MKSINVILLFMMCSFLTQSVFAQSFNYTTNTGDLGTTYSWIDCSTSAGGTEVADLDWLQNDGLGDKKDDGYTMVAWPFNFQFYDSYYFVGDEMSVCTNGFIRLDGIASDDASDTYNNSINSYSPNLGEIISLAMEDCGIESTNSHVYYRTTGTSPNRVFSIEMDNLEIRFDQNKYADVEVSFYETSNKIVLKLGSETISTSAYMGIHSGNSSYKNQWQDINGATQDRWREYTPPAKSSPTITVTQASAADVYPSTDNEVLKIQFDISGAGGAYNLNTLNVTASNTINSDVGNVKLYHTTENVFSTEHQIGSSTTISSGKYNFSSLSYDMPGGTSYVWVAYDINSNPTNGNGIDGYIATNDINLNGTTYPSTDQDPSTHRTISFFEWDGSTSTDWTVAANWSNNSVPTSADNVIIPSGPSNQPHLPTTYNGYCNNLEIQSGATLTIENSNKNLKVYGNINNEGTLDVTGGYNILLYGSDNIITGGGDYSTARFRLRGSGVQYTLNVDLSIYRFDIDGGSSLYVNDKSLVCSNRFKAIASSETTITSGIISSGGTVTLDGTFTAGTGTFYYSGSNSQSIINKTYYNLKVRISSGTRNLSNVSSNFQNLELVNLSTSSGTATLGSALNFDGNITVGEYCILDLNGNDINVEKNWYNDGSITLGINTVTFDGNGSSHIYGNTSFYNLTINKSYGDVYVEETTNVSNTFTLTNGVVYSSTSALIIIDASCSTVGGSSYSYVDGPLRKDGTSAYTFHIGDFRKYSPIAISAPASSTQFTAHYHSDEHSNTSSMESPLTKVSLIEYWDLDRVGSTSSVNVTLYWYDGTYSGIQTLSDLRIGHYNGSTWENMGNDATTGTASSGTITANTVTDFSPFAFATTDNTSNTLPIKMNSFELDKIEEGVLVNWSTAIEENNDYFSIERTTDGEQIETIATLKGAGNSNTIKSYSIIDKNPPSGIVYYRVRQTDFDGKTEAFNWKSINIGNEFDFAIYPNPNSNGILNLTYGDYSGEAIAEIYSIDGRLIQSNKVSFSNGQNQLNHNIKTGYYLLRVKVNNVSITERLIVE